MLGSREAKTQSGLCHRVEEIEVSLLSTVQDRYISSEMSTIDSRADRGESDPTPLRKHVARSVGSVRVGSVGTAKQVGGKQLRSPLGKALQGRTTQAAICLQNCHLVLLQYVIESNLVYSRYLLESRRKLCFHQRFVSPEVKILLSWSRPGEFVVHKRELRWPLRAFGGGKGLACMKQLQFCFAICFSSCTRGYTLSSFTAVKNEHCTNAVLASIETQ